MYYTFGGKLANFNEFYNGYESTEQVWHGVCGVCLYRGPFHRLTMPLKPGFHSNAIACVAFEWKPGFTLLLLSNCAQRPCLHQCTSSFDAGGLHCGLHHDSNMTRHDMRITYAQKLKGQPA